MDDQTAEDWAEGIVADPVALARALRQVAESFNFWNFQCARALRLAEEEHDPEFDGEDLDVRVDSDEFRALHADLVMGARYLSLFVAALESAAKVDGGQLITVTERVS